jgi:L-threonylcarbamoyladenylate synthase
MTDPAGSIRHAAGGPHVFRSDDPGALDAAVTALQAGQLVGIPTETVYGIAVLPTEGHLDALLEAKRRPAEKGFQMIIDGLDQVADLVMVTPVATTLAATFWPGALTLALPLQPDVDLPELLTGGRRTLGLRLPDHPVPRAIARLAGPIAVSSANLSGEPPALDAQSLLAAVGPALSVVIDDGPVRGGVASTVVGVETDGTLTFFRIGALTEETVRAALHRYTGGASIAEEFRA